MGSGPTCRWLSLLSLSFFFLFLSSPFFFTGRTPADAETPPSGGGRWCGCLRAPGRSPAARTASPRHTAPSRAEPEARAPPARLLRLGQLGHGGRASARRRQRPQGGLGHGLTAAAVAQGSAALGEGVQGAGESRRAAHLRRPWRARTHGRGRPSSTPTDRRPRAQADGGNGAAALFRARG